MLKLGCIADDLACAMALADNLVSAGMRVVLARGTPQGPLAQDLADTQAVVIAVGTRGADSSQAVVRSLGALVWLKSAGAEQIFAAFNPRLERGVGGRHFSHVGPVMDALMTALQTDFSLLCPASPEQHITVYKGHVFSGNDLVALSLPDRTKTTFDKSTLGQTAKLLPLLQAQTRRKSDRLDHAQVSVSSVAIQEGMAQLRLTAVEVALADASSPDDMVRLGQAAKGMRLVAGSPSLATGLPGNFDIFPGDRASDLPAPGGYAAVVCGSRTALSASQAKHFQALGYPAMVIDPLKVAKFGVARVAQAAAAWATPLLTRGPVMLSSAVDADSAKLVQNLLGVDAAEKLVSDCLSDITCALVQLGVRRLVLAGTLTSKSCLKGLGVHALRVGKQVSPGAPWCHALADASPDPAGLHLCLKPGHVGEDDFFSRAFSTL